MQEFHSGRLERSCKPSGNPREFESHFLLQARELHKHQNEGMVEEEQDR